MKIFDDYIKQIPLYQSLYGTSLDTFSFDKLLHYPILEKSYLINGFPNNWMTEELKKAIKCDLIETTTTSGTTGNRVQILREKKWWLNEYKRTYAYSEYLRNFNVGVSRKAILTTAVCSNSTCYLDFPSYEERIFKDTNTLYLNLARDPNNWSKDDILRMKSELNEFQPEYLDADPVYLALFLKKLKQIDKNAYLHFPKVITLSYELVTCYLRRFIKSHLNIPIINLYGTTEVGYIFIENHGQMVHCSNMSKIEFVPFHKKKKLYYLVLSSLKNKYMPLLRFKIGDLVKLDSTSSSVELICGRVTDIVSNENGDPVTPGEIDLALSHLQNNILVYQIQIGKENLLFRYMSSDDFPLSNQDQEKVQEILKQLLGINFQVRFNLERSISPETSGKFLLVKKV